MSKTMTTDASNTRSLSHFISYNIEIIQPDQKIIHDISKRNVC